MKNKKLFLLILLSCFWGMSCSTNSDISPEDPNNITPLSGNEVDANEILEIMNTHRANGATCGNNSKDPVPALVWSVELEQAALNHSQDMFQKDYFSHTSKDGTEPDERIAATGYSFSTWGENIAQGQDTEIIVMKSWMNSTGHCNNIMNPNFEEVGVAKSGDYWVQVFAKPK